MTDHADILIEGATVVDGTGAPGRAATVTVVDGRIRVIATGEPAPAHVGRRVDAAGKVVAPGFIDLHSHGGLVILADGRHEPKVRQGVTTEVIGVDGNGFAPFVRREDLEAFVNLDAGLDGRPDIDYDWTSVGELPRSVRRHGQPQHRDARRQLAAAHRRARLGRRSGRRRARSTGCAACSATGWPRARSG